MTYLLLRECGPMVVAFLHVDVNCGRGGQWWFPTICRSDEQREPRSSLCGKEKDSQAPNMGKGNIHKEIVHFRSFSSDSSHRGFLTASVNPQSGSDIENTFHV